MTIVRNLPWMNNMLTKDCLLSFFPLGVSHYSKVVENAEETVWFDEVRLFSFLKKLLWNINCL